MATVDRKAAIAAQIDADLAAQPLPRAKLDLLWLGAEYLSLLRSLGGRLPNFIGEQTDVTEMLQRCSRALQAGEITIDDVDWALKVDQQAGAAEGRFHAGDVLGAIAAFREGLRLAPGCDNYMMSMAICFYQLGMPKEALRYLERAHEINPESARIARKLQELRTDLGVENDEAEENSEPPPARITFEHPEGLFSLRHPAGWRRIEPISEGAALAFLVDDGALLFEVMCFARDGGSGLVTFLADGLARHGGGRVVSRLDGPLHGADSATLLLEAEESGLVVQTWFLIAGRGNRALYLAAKAPKEVLGRNVYDVEAVFASLRAPWMDLEAEEEEEEDVAAEDEPLDCVAGADGWVTFNHPDGWFSVRYPETWKGYKTDESNEIQLRSGGDDSAAAHASIRYWSDPSPEARVQLTAAAYAHSLPGSGFTPGAVKSILNGRIGEVEYAGVLVEYEAEPDLRHAEEPRLVSYIWIGSGEDVVQFNLSVPAPAAEPSLRDFHQVVQSLRAPWLKMAPAIPPPNSGDADIPESWKALIRKPAPEREVEAAPEPVPESGGSSTLAVAVFIAIAFGVLAWLLSSANG